MIRIGLDEALRRASRDDDAPTSTVTTESVLAEVGQQGRPQPRRWALAGLALVLALGVVAGWALWGRPNAPTPPASSPATALPSGFEWASNPADQPMDDALALARCPTRPGERVWEERSQQTFGGHLSFIPVGATPAPDDYEQSTRDCWLGYDRAPVTTPITAQELGSAGKDGYRELCGRHSGLGLATAGFRPLGSDRDTAGGPSESPTVAVFTRADGQLVTCTLLPDEGLAWLDFLSAPTASSLCHTDPFQIGEVTEDAKGRASVVAVRLESVVAMRNPDSLQLDTRPTRVRITAPAPWSVDITRPVHEGIVITAAAITLRHPVPADAEGGPRVPYVVRALDAKGKVLFTCSS